MTEQALRTWEVAVAHPERDAFVRIILGFHPSGTPAVTVPYLKVVGLEGQP